LLRLDNPIEDSSVEELFPLARYAAEHWIRHAQVEDVSSRIKGMEYLFDLDKPYFMAWRQLYDIDTRPPRPSAFYQFAPISKSGANTPLYHAALCGFANLVERLIVKYPQHVNAIGGYYMTPAVAALAGRHFHVAQVLHSNGSSVDPRGNLGKSPLHSAAYYGDLEMVQVLLDYGVDVNTRNDFGFAPLDFASWDHFHCTIVVQFLLEHGADPNVRTRDGSTPLHEASQNGRIEMARLLIEHGANPNARMLAGLTPLHLASQYGKVEMARLLIEHGASVEVEDIQGGTPLEVASASGAG
jgi:cytohesin